MIKRYAFILCALTIALAACNSNSSSSGSTDAQGDKAGPATTTDAAKTAPSTQALVDDKIIKAYITTNKITAQKDSASGLYYQIIKQGTGATATIASKVQLDYVGKTLNGTVFDQSTSPMTFPLNQLIRGWQIGIPLVKAGGKILLIIPSELAYGAESPSDKIPANSVLVFTIDVFSIQ